MKMEGKESTAVEGPTRPTLDWTPLKRRAIARFVHKVWLATALREAHILSYYHLAGP
jgi:hypothetical protein